MDRLDLTKYEGHTPKPEWNDYLRYLIQTPFGCPTKADRNLLLDAPLLLAEVEKLRTENKRLGIEVSELRATCIGYRQVNADLRAKLERAKQLLLTIPIDTNISTTKWYSEYALLLADLDKGEKDGAVR